MMFIAISKLRNNLQILNADAHLYWLHSRSSVETCAYVMISKFNRFYDARLIWHWNETWAAHDNKRRIFVLKLGDLS